MPPDQESDESFARSLRAWRKSKDLTQGRLGEMIAEIIGRPVPYNTVSTWESGTVPSGEIPNALRILGFRSTPMEELERAADRSVKNYAYVNARTLHGAEYGEAMLRVPANFPIDGHGALPCVSDAMMPFLHPGDQLIFADTVLPRRDRVFAFRMPNGQPPDVRELCYDAGVWSWQSWDPSAPTLEYRKEDLIGMLVGLISVNGGLTIGPISEGIGRGYFEQVSRVRFGM